MKSQSFLGLGVVFALILLFYIFVVNQKEGKFLNNLVVNIKNDIDTNHFVTSADIKKMIIEQSGKQLPDISVEQLDLRALERTVKGNMFVSNCQISVDIRGNLVVDIKENKPLARLAAPSGKGAYISSEMVILPLSERSTARVLILSGGGVNKLFAPDFWQSEKGKNLFELLKYIDSSKFWKAQVAELHLDEQLGLTILPQVGDEKIEFGTGDNYREKFENLMIFYHKIVQHKGWQTYQKVNLRVDNQIICK